MEWKKIKTPKLKACPFCGRTDLEMWQTPNEKFTISCKCGCELSRDASSIQSARTIWNRRRPPKSF